jgi:anti-sigma B factor antagonist
MIPLAFTKLLEGPSLEIMQREKDGIAVLDLDGRVVQGDDDLALRLRLESLAASGQKNVILNLKKVSEIDTTGQGSLEYCGEKFRELGGKCVLLDLDPAGTKVPDVFKLSTDFETYDEEVDAVNSFFPDRKVPHYDILDFVAKLKTEASEEATK